MSIRAFLGVRLGKGAAIAFAVVVTAYVSWTLTAGDDSGWVERVGNTQTWIDLDGNVFDVRVEPFTESPKGPTGKTAFKAELCFWTADGKRRETPVPVLLNSHRGVAAPTFCPDCGRLVVALNPRPVTDLPDDEQRVPPTKAEMANRSGKPRS